ncbi:MAG TPA: hypothetical protein VK705_01395, partial [Ferruginibacter sp.]|nr:hypothetical protein [Ferruginibacter sp.]
MKTTHTDSINYNRRHHLEDSILIRMTGIGCKNRTLIITQNDPPVELKENRDVPKPAKDPLIILHGNILYNYNYRSYIDTPFAQRNMMQHMVQSYINGNIANKYPFRAIFTYRGSNSPYFSNNSDVSIQYRQPDMLEQIKSDLRKDADSLLDKNLLVNPSVKYKMGDTSLLAYKNSNPLIKGLYSKYDSLYGIYKQDRDKLAQLEGQADNKNPLQALIEAREAKMFKKVNPTDSITDSLNRVMPTNIWGGAKQGESFSNIQNDTAVAINKLASDADMDSAGQAKIKQRQDSIMKLRKAAVANENKILLLQKHLTDSVSMLTRQINHLNSPETVNDYMDRNDTTERNRLTKAQKILLSVDQISIGRSWLNYSELTVKNVSLNGFNLEMNPGKLYMATAIGSINNQFRDFVLNNNTSTNQSVGLVRLGVGKKNKTNLIFTLYGGRKALLNTTGVGDSAATQSIMGASLAGTVAVTKNTSVTAEYARSSYDNIYNPGQTNKRLFGRVVNFRMSTNAAWNFSFQSIYPKTNTKIDGSYTTMGAAFQSFTIYASNVKQDAYLLHANQLLWKKRLSIDASIRKNDFNSPLTAPGYSNTAVFKSLQVSLAIPKYPFVSIGYYPSTQLFVGSGNVVYQGWYNTLNTIASYSYKLAKLNMSTNAVYTKFYNNQSDTSFAYFNAGTFTLNHSVYLSPFVFEGILTITDQVGIHLSTIEPLVTYKYKNILSLTGGITWSRLNGVQTLWGGTAG